MMENRYVWIENIKSFSGRHKIDGDLAVGRKIWLPVFFDESSIFSEFSAGDSVYHFLDFSMLIGVSKVCGEATVCSSSRKYIKRVSYLEGIASGIKLKQPIKNITYSAISLDDFKEYDAKFEITKAFNKKTINNAIQIDGSLKNDFELFLSNILSGRHLIKVPFRLWYILINIVPRRID